MPSASDLVERTRGYLDGWTRESLNELSSVVDTVSTSVVLGRTVPDTITPGSVLSVGLESMYVWAYDPTNNTCAVRRGFNGTSPLTHAPLDLVRVNPRWTDAQVFASVNTAIGALSSSLFNAKSITRTFSWAVRGLDLASDIVGDQVLEVAYLTYSGLKEWRQIYDYRVRLDVSTSDYASGKALIPRVGSLPDGVTVRIQYAADLSTLTNLSDDVATVSGLAASATDLPAIGAAVDLMAGQAAQRANVTRAPQGRRPEETSTSDVLNSGQALRALYQRRLGEEKSNQSARWPVYLHRWAL